MDIRTRSVRRCDSDVQKINKRTKKGAGLRFGVKAEVTQTRDDASDVSEITDVPHLTVPRI